MLNNAQHPFDKWFVFHPILGKQRKSFSDVELKMVDHNVP